MDKGADDGNALKAENVSIKTQSIIEIMASSIMKHNHCWSILPFIPFFFNLVNKKIHNLTGKNICLK